MRGGVRRRPLTAEQRMVLEQYKRLLDRWIAENVTYTTERLPDGKVKHTFSTPDGEALEITELLEVGDEGTVS